MADEPNNGRYNMQQTDEEYRRRQAAKAQRRKKRKRQRMLLLGAMALALLLVIICLIFIIRAIFGMGKAPSSSSSMSTPSSVSSSVPALTHPVAKDSTAWNLVLINGQTEMPAGFDPELVSIPPVGYLFDARAVDQLNAMIAACNENAGYSLQIFSAYRGEDRQNEFYQKAVENYIAQGHDAEMAKILAWKDDPPYGYSDHQTGLAAAFYSNTAQTPGNSEQFAASPEYQWLMENAANFGFILRFPSEKEDITGVTFKSYHWRFVGVDEAHDIMGAGICLEEYLLAVPESTA